MPRHSTDCERISKHFKEGDIVSVEVNSIRSAQQLKFIWAVVGQAFANWNEKYPKPATVDQLMQTLKHECGLTEERRRMNLKTGETVIEIVPLSIKLAVLEPKRMNDFVNNVVSVLALMLGVSESDLTESAKLNMKD